MTNWIEFFQVMCVSRQREKPKCVPLEVAVALDHHQTDRMARTWGMLTMPPGDANGKSKNVQQWIDEFSEGAA